MNLLETYHFILIKFINVREPRALKKLRPRGSLFIQMLGLASGLDQASEWTYT